MELKRHQYVRFWLGVLTALAGLALTVTPGTRAAAIPQGHVENVRWEQVGPVINVYYDLRADRAGDFTVRLQIVRAAGDSAEIPLTSLAGDVGPNVAPGAGKKIVWEFGRDVETIQLRQIRFAVNAVPAPAATPPTPRGKLIVRTTPPGATVSIDGEASGSTPLTIDVGAGLHRVVMSRPGYLENSAQVTVTAGQTTTLERPLTAAAAEEAATQRGAGQPPVRGGFPKWIWGVAGGAGAAAAVAASKGGGGGAGNSPEGPPAVSSVVATPNLALVGTSVSFSAAATDPNADTLTYSWDFGDSGTGSGATPTHLYVVAGTFTVRVTVSDGKSSATGQTTVTTRTLTGTWLNINPVTNSPFPDSEVHTYTHSGGLVTGGAVYRFPVGGPAGGSLACATGYTTTITSGGVRTATPQVNFTYSCVTNCGQTAGQFTWSFNPSADLNTLVSTVTSQGCFSGAPFALRRQ